ncbi:MAG: hypothetical protein P4M08_06310 [Oligoflexia bacterium]|nr:hypothetical protein [Oligoflexia bacterium]
MKSYHWIGLKTQCSSCHTDPHRNHLSRKFQGRCEECHDNNAWKIKTFDHAKITHYSLNGKHAEINCTQCHIQTPAVLAQGEAGRKSYHWMGLKAQCLSCHKDVHRFGAWRSKKFKSPNQCLECHDEKIWKPARFNHTDDTRFPIDGKHVGLKCEDCHVIKDKDKKPIRAVYHWNNLRQKNCALCHKNPHIGSPNPQFRLKRCDQCHVTAGWIILLNGKAFDHKTTRFPLTGKHLSAKCKDCHEIKGKPIYRWETAAQDFCISCHRNVHQSQFHGKFSEKNCSACHTTNDFTHRLSFNHNETSFPLRLKHEEAKCEKCHVPTGRLFASSKDIKDHEPIHKFLFPEIKGKGCVGCHKDVHRGEFGASCTECHNEASWKKTKDFHKNFTLNGIHKTLGCAECHKDGRRLEGMSQNCALCHQKDDVHNGTLPNCGECHKQLFWENPEFQHSLTQFPLRGIHRTLDCNTCHSRGIYRGTPSNCSDCHLSQAPLVTNPPVPAHVFPQMLNCAECHNQFQF